MTSINETSGFYLLRFYFRAWLKTANEKVYEKYFTGIYSFKEVLEILCMKKKNQGYLSLRKSLKMVHFDVDFKINIFQLL